MKTIYDINEWNHYSRSHASVLSSFQLNLFQEAVSYLEGDVVDCGCGSARLTPYLADKISVTSYTGIDMAEEMVAIANHVIARLNRKNFKIINQRIEEVKGRFNSAVSIHSYYSWPEPAAVLSHIFSMLERESKFVLATPNKKLDMPRLLQEVDKELYFHPDYEIFREMNLKFASNAGAHFIPLNELVSQVQSVGFEIELCHQDHYLGGVNFLVLNRP